MNEDKTTNLWLHEVPRQGTECLYQVTRAMPIQLCQGRRAKLLLSRRQAGMRPIAGDDQVSAVLLHLKVFRLLPSELAQACCYSRGTIKRYLWLLRRQGLVRRQRNGRWTLA